MFSHRQWIEKNFETYCKEHGHANCAGNFLAWLISNPEGKQVVIDLYHDVMSDMLIDVVRQKTEAL
jgi:hypothetical protein